MSDATNVDKRLVNRRKLLKGGMLAGGAAVVGAGLLNGGTSALGQEAADPGNGSLSNSDVAILRFLTAAELIEADLWQQYAELGGVSASNPYQAALSNLDGDAQQYISSNTTDEISHATFLNAYLASKGARTVNFDRFRNLQGSTATGAQNIGRLTNLMDVVVDTSWYIRYRSTTNPDLGGTYPQAITIKNRPAIPRNDADLNNPKLIQVLANTAAFHFGTIEQGGSSVYASLSRKVSNTEVLNITLSIGADEVAHYLLWSDFASNAVKPPVAPVSDGQLTFPDFTTKGSLFQPNLIFPVPAHFISNTLPRCAVIRPITTAFGGARAAVNSLVNANLFKGQPQEFIFELQTLANEADASARS